MKNKNWLLLSFSIVIILISGCLGSSEKTPSMKERAFGEDTYESDGRIQGQASSTPTRISENIHIQIPHENVTLIKMDIILEDGDQGTNTDHIESVKISLEGNDNIQERGEGDTSYTTNATFSWNEETTLSSSLYVEVTAMIYGGEDEWPGPLIWRGAIDTGIMYQIDVDYEYISSETVIGSS